MLMDDTVLFSTTKPGHVVKSGRGPGSQDPGPCKTGTHV